MTSKRSTSPIRNDLAPADVESDPRWASVCSRDSRADGSFFYSVVTTGVYCYPSCNARRPRPENVAFHPTSEAAQSAGYRPCQRCRPELPPPAERRAVLVASLCRFIEQRTEEPSLDELAVRAGLSVHHTHRLFKGATGLTPRAYWTAHRHARVRERLQSRASVTEVVLGAGYNSSARFYEKSQQVLGMTPSQYKAGGAGADIRYAEARTSLGPLLVAATGRGVCAILLGETPDKLERDLAKRFPRARRLVADSSFATVLNQVVSLIEEPSSDVRLPLDIRGTAFQQRVWQALSKIAPGTVATYADLAHHIGSPRAARAVGRACAANALAVAVPCHRVVREDGSLGGYRWGVERKRVLLERERAAKEERR